MLQVIKSRGTSTIKCLSKQPIIVFDIIIFLVFHAPCNDTWKDFYVSKLIVELRVSWNEHASKIRRLCVSTFNFCAIPSDCGFAILANVLKSYHCWHWLLPAEKFAITQVHAISGKMWAVNLSHLLSETRLTYNLKTVDEFYANSWEEREDALTRDGNRRSIC